jgi:hypothetical protein
MASTQMTVEYFSRLKDETSKKMKGTVEGKDALKLLINYINQFVLREANHWSKFSADSNNGEHTERYSVFTLGMKISIFFLFLFLISFYDFPL